MKPTRFLFAILLQCVYAGENEFIGKDTSSEVFGVDEKEIFPAAYVDLNADKLTDLVAVSRDRTSLDIFLAHSEAPYLRRALDSQNITDVDKESRIISVKAGDFTGDGLLDLMVTLRKDSITFEDFIAGNETSVKVIFCQVMFEKDIALDCSGPELGNPTFPIVQEPMALDLNGDMVLDLLGEVWAPYVANGIHVWKKRRTVWYSQNSKTMFDWEVVEFPLLHDFYPDKDIRDMVNISSNLFADLDGDDIPELVIISEDPTDSRDKSNYYMETFEILKDADHHTKFRFKKAPKLLDSVNETKVLGQPVIIDLQHNGHLDYLLPYCTDFHCKHFGIYVISSEGEVESLPLNSFHYGSYSWSFIPPERPPKNDTSTNTTTPTPPTTTRRPIPPEFFKMELFYSKALVLRVGDYNLDGYPDLLTVLETEGKGGQNRITRAVVLENVECKSTEDIPCPTERTFSANFDIFKDFSNVISASFYDIKDNGVLDVFLVKQHQAAQAGQNQEFVIKTIENEMNFDSSFLKFIVLTGQSCETCDGGIPYGNVLPGAKIRYSSLNAKGHEEFGAMAQAYRSSHMPLDLPCSVFGIGHSPNFIETFSVSVAPSIGEKYKKEWKQIIPNSQVVVWPNPVNRPEKWTMKLYLTPSEAVLKTFGILVGLCVVLGSLVGLLEFKERWEDQKARRNEAYSRIFM